MSLKRTGQLSFVEALMSEGLGHNGRLEKVSRLVKWRRFERVLAGLRDSGPGRPGYRPLLMFKALLLQAWYGLSDAELEEALGDRLSFRAFVGLSLEDAVPDHTTFCRFRNALVAAKLMEKLFAEFDRQLEAAGMILKRGTMLDATLIEAAPTRPRRPADEPRRDPDAAFTKKNGGTHYGYKAHVGVDDGWGFIRALVTTPANVTGRSTHPRRRESGVWRQGLRQPRSPRPKCVQSALRDRDFPSKAQTCSRRHAETPANKARRRISQQSPTRGSVQQLRLPRFRATRQSPERVISVKPPRIHLLSPSSRARCTARVRREASRFS